MCHKEVINPEPFGKCDVTREYVNMNFFLPEFIAFVIRILLPSHFDILNKQEHHV